MFDCINNNNNELDNNIRQQQPDIQVLSFSGDCTQTGAASFSATGDIIAGGQETCNIENHFTITAIP
jgi:hypothetical protein